MRSGLLAPALALAVACASLPAPRAIPACPGAEVATVGLPGDFVVRLRMRIRGAGADVSLEVVAQQRADELVVIAWNALGAKVSTIVQRGMAVDVDALPAPVLPVAPINILRDLELSGVLRSRDRDAQRLVIPHPTCGYESEIEVLSREALP